MHTPDRMLSHPGRPHLDDLLTAALLVAKFPDIERWDRKEPTDEEIKDDRVCVFDVGLEWEPGRSNFDHHQLKHLDNECSFTLLCRHLDLDADMRDTFGWYSLMAPRDNEGVRGVANALDCGTAPVKRLMANPVEKWLLGEIQSHAALSKTETPFLWDLLFSMGHNMLTHVEDLKARLWYLARNIQPVRAAGLQGMYLPHDPNVTPSPFGLSEYRNRYYPAAEFTISPDTRGPGHSLFRYSENLLDFRRVAEDSLIDWVHRTGFCASTDEKIPLEWLLELITDAAVLVVK